MTAWARARLGECCEIVSGATPSTTVPNYWDGEIWWATPKDLSDLEGTRIAITARRITAAGLASCAASILPAGSVLFSSRAPIGHVAINSVPMATNQGFKSFIPNPELLHAPFLYWWLRANRPYLESLGNGATFKEVSKAIVAGVTIPVPPLSEQRRIAGILDRADALRAKRRAALAQIDGLTQAIFLEMFGDPVRNARSWPKAAFGDLCDTRLGRMLDQKQQTGRSKRPYLRNANVRWFEFDLSSVYEMDFDPSIREAMRLEDGDLLICEGGEPGRAAVWRGQISECYFQKALHRARPNTSRTNAVFLAWLLWFLAHDGGLGDHVTSATIAHLTGEKLKAMAIPVPPVSLQRAFASRAAAVDKLKAAHRASLAQLDALFASLQHRAFRGEL